MSVTTSPHGYVFHDPDPDVVDGVYGYRDSAGDFRSNAQLRDMARANIARRVDGRNPQDVLAEALTEEQALDMLVDDIHQPDDNAAWAMDSESGRWDAEA